MFCLTDRKRLGFRSIPFSIDLYSICLHKTHECHIGNGLGLTMVAHHSFHVQILQCNMRIVGGKYCSDLLCQITSYTCHFPLCIGNCIQFPVVVRLFLAFQTFLLVLACTRLSSVRYSLYFSHIFSAASDSLRQLRRKVSMLTLCQRSTPAIRAPQRSDGCA